MAKDKEWENYTVSFYIKGQKAAERAVNFGYTVVSVGRGFYQCVSHRQVRDVREIQFPNMACIQPKIEKGTPAELTQKGNFMPKPTELARATANYIRGLR